MKTSQPFDSYAQSYDSALGQGLRWTGESRDYFARERVRVTAEIARRLGAPVRDVCDFGCGTGETLPLLAEVFQPRTLVGFDTSVDSLRVAGERNVVPSLEFTTDLTTPEWKNRFDLVYCNGVFHHIPLRERAAAAASILESLRPGGLWFCWENNPWNPGTRWVMSRIPFDRDAIVMSSRQARRMASDAGFRTVSVQYHFFFPGWLRGLRPFERKLNSLPLGGQYVTAFARTACAESA